MRSSANSNDRIQAETDELVSLTRDEKASEVDCTNYAKNDAGTSTLSSTGPPKVMKTDSGISTPYALPQKSHSGGVLGTIYAEENGVRENSHRTESPSVDLTGIDSGSRGALRHVSKGFGNPQDGQDVGRGSSSSHDMASNSRELLSQTAPIAESTIPNNKSPVKSQQTQERYSIASWFKRRKDDWKSQ